MGGRDDWTSMSGRQRKEFTLRLLAVYGPVCCICGLPIERRHGEWVDLSCQHIQPRSRGGLTSLANCRPAHGRCNSSLGARPQTSPDLPRHHDPLFATPGHPARMPDRVVFPTGRARTTPRPLDFSPRFRPKNTDKPR